MCARELLIRGEGEAIPSGQSVNDKTSATAMKVADHALSRARIIRDQLNWKHESLLWKHENMVLTTSP